MDVAFEAALIELGFCLSRAVGAVSDVLVVFNSPSSFWLSCTEASVTS
jgi:hypothetical protein